MARNTSPTAPTGGSGGGSLLTLVLTIAGGMGMLIFIYLLLAKGQNTPALITSIGNNVASVVKTLQGN